MSRPSFLPRVQQAVTPAKVYDITSPKPVPIEPWAAHVFDLGYYDFGR